MTTIRTRTLAAIAAAALILTPGLSACGQGVEEVAEQAAENAMGGGDVEINDDGVTITDEEGNEMAAGENVALPDSWPSEVPPFEGGTLTVVTVSPDGSYAAWTTEGSPEDVVGAYGATLEEAGYVVGNEGAAAGAVFREYTGNGYTVTLSATEDAGQTMLMLTAVTGS